MSSSMLRTEAGRPRSREIALTVGATLAAAVLAFALAPLGTGALYGIGGLAACAVLFWATRRELLPPLRDAVDRVRPRASQGRPALSLRPSVAVAVGTALGVAVLSLLVAGWGLVTLGVIAGVLVLALAIWLCWPLIKDLVTRPPEDSPRPARAAAIRAGAPRSARGRASAVAVMLLAIGPLAIVLAQLGVKGLVAAASVAVAAALLVVVRDRSVFFTFVAVVSLTVVLHKSFGPQDLEESGGAVAVYITTFDVVVVLLYALWIREGTFGADARAAIRQRVIWVPLAGALFLLPSLLVAPSIWHAASELARMAWMYLLYFYVAVRVRTRRHVWAVLGGLTVFAVVELVVVLGQWATGGNLGLSFLGVPAELTQRISDVGTLGRPFGTIIHPVFMGAVMGSLALMALSLAIHLQRSLTKVVAAVMVLGCGLPLYLAHTRASVLAAVVVAVYVVGTGLSRRRLTWSTLGRFGLAALGAGLVFLPQLSAKFSENFFTSHFFEEIQSRMQLNGIALQMIGDHWLLGIGLNNFEIVLPRYEPHFVIFANNPVHNLYLLYLSETGLVGFVGFCLIGWVMFRAALRLARATDRLFAGIGIGVVAVMAFLAVEELLGFSLRQDVPLVVYWLLAGLVVACLRLAGPIPPSSRGAARPVQRGRVRSGAADARRQRRPGQETSSGAAVSRGRRRRPGDGRPEAVSRAARIAVGTLRRGAPFLARPLARRPRLAALLLAGALGVALAPATALGEPAVPAGGGILFEATVRATGRDAVFRADADGTHIVQLTPNDGRNYSWPRWAYGNRKVVYTSRTPFSKGAASEIDLMNADGSDPQVITSFDFAVGQPRVDETGTFLLFTADAPWFPQDAIFKLNLATLESVNLTAVTEPQGGLDADPVLTRDQRSVVFVAGSVDSAGIEEMSIDGADRRDITHDAYWNTDPDISPDGTQVAISSYRGSGGPKLDTLKAKPYDFHLVLHDTTTGTERVLTEGGACSIRPPSDPCTVEQMSAYAPRFTPDGRQVAFVGALDRTTTCICIVGVDGSDPHALILSSALGINWLDFSGDDTAANWSAIGSRQSHTRLLVTLAAGDGSASSLVEASTDLMHRTPVDLPDGLEPIQARWSPDRSQIVFTARVPVPATPSEPHPAPPPGEIRREHVTLADLDPVQLALRASATTADPEEQVFLRTADGSVRALTDPWIEDWRDGVRPGDARANTDPQFTPDGRAVLVTNTSTLTGESFVLRIDLATGDVLNLTNATSGAVPVADRTPVMSPDGSRVAFTSTVGTDTGVYTMAPDGFHVDAITAAGSPEADPIWLRGGQDLLSVRADPSGGVLVRTHVADGRQTPLTAAISGPVTRPVLDPGGGMLVFLGQSQKTITVFRVPTAGGSAPVVLQPDPTHQYLDVDWR